MKIVVLNTDCVSKDDIDWSLFHRYKNVELRDHLTRELELKYSEDADIIACERTRVDREFIEHAKKLKLVIVMSTGYNQVDIEACRERNITVCNVPSYGTAIVAQFTVALILEACHRVGDHSNFVKRGGWEEDQEKLHWFTKQIDLEGKTLGVIGYGRIGKRVAEIMKVFGMNIVYANGDPGYLDEVLKKSDVITLHCNYTKKNHHLMNKEAFQKMKKGSILVNTARGGLVDESALYDALVSKKLFAAAVDVTEKEPMPKNHPLLTLDNYIVTPHMAWGAREPRQEIVRVTIENIDRFLQGDPINVVS